MPVFHQRCGFKLKQRRYNTNERMMGRSALAVKLLATKNRWNVLSFGGSGRFRLGWKGLVPLFLQDGPLLVLNVTEVYNPYLELLVRAHFVGAWLFCTLFSGQDPLDGRAVLGQVFVSQLLSIKDRSNFTRGLLQRAKEEDMLSGQKTQIVETWGRKKTPLGTWYIKKNLTKKPNTSKFDLPKSQGNHRLHVFSTLKIMGWLHYLSLNFWFARFPHLQPTTKSGPQLLHLLSRWRWRLKRVLRWDGMGWCLDLKVVG